MNNINIFANRDYPHTTLLYSFRHKHYSSPRLGNGNLFNACEHIYAATFAITSVFLCMLHIYNNILKTGMNAIRKIPYAFIIQEWIARQVLLPVPGAFCRCIGASVQVCVQTLLFVYIILIWKCWPRFELTFLFQIMWMSLVHTCRNNNGCHDGYYILL